MPSCSTRRRAATAERAICVAVRKRSYRPNPPNPYGYAMPRPDPSDTRRCVVCGNLLMGKRADAETCSTRCRVRKNYGTLNRILIPKFGDLTIGAVTVKDVRLLIGDLKRSGLSPATIHAYLMPLRGVLTYAVAEYDVAANPCDKLSRADARGTTASRRSTSGTTKDRPAPPGPSHPVAARINQNQCRGRSVLLPTETTPGGGRLGAQNHAYLR
jgi:predicted nucleic acid-binding Zn ribbon protein